MEFAHIRKMKIRSYHRQLHDRIPKYCDGVRLHVDTYSVKAQDYEGRKQCVRLTVPVLDMTYSRKAAISSSVWNIVFKTIANWSRRRLYVHRRRRLHCRRYWCNKFWENVILCCRRSVWVAFHNLWFFTHTLICIHTIFLSRYLCWKENKGPKIFRRKSKLLIRRKFLTLPIAPIFLHHRRTDQCSYKASFECLQIHTETQKCEHTKIYLQSQTRINLFKQKRAHKDTEEKLHVQTTHTHLHLERRAHRDARRYKRIHTHRYTQIVFFFVFLVSVIILSSLTCDYGYVSKFCFYLLRQILV